MAINFDQTTPVPKVTGKINFDKVLPGNYDIVPTSQPVQSTVAPAVKQEPKKSFLRKTADFFTNFEQEGGKILGAAASTISPEVNKNRQSVLDLSKRQYDTYLNLAKKATDKTKKTEYLNAAKKAADTSGYDIYNDPEYQKTAKQIYGTFAGVALDAVTAGTVGKATTGMKSFVKSKALPTVASAFEKQGIKNVAKELAKDSLKIGTPIGAGYGAASGMEQNQDLKGIAKSTALGAGIGGVAQFALGGALQGLGSVLGKKAPAIVEKTVAKEGAEVGADVGKALAIIPGEVAKTPPLPAGKNMGKGFIFSDKVDPKSVAVTKAQNMINGLEENYQAKLKQYNKNPTPEKLKSLQEYRIGINKQIEELSGLIKKASGEITSEIPYGKIDFSKSNVKPVKIEAPQAPKLALEGTNIPPKTAKTAPKSPILAQKVAKNVAETVAPSAPKAELMPVKNSSALANKATNIVQDSKELPKKMTKNAPKVKESKPASAIEYILKQNEFENLKRELSGEPTIRATTPKNVFPKVTADTPGAKVSGARERISADEILKNMEVDADEPAMYLSRNRQQQSEDIASFINNEYERAIGAIDDLNMLPKDISPVRFYKEISALAQRNNDIELLKKIRKSPLASFKSQSASELSMGVGDDVYSTEKALDTVDKLFENITKEEIRKEVPKIKKAMKEVKISKGAWVDFVNEIKCK